VTLDTGGIDMLDRNTAETIIYRIAVAAFGYYPGKEQSEPGYTLDEDIDWCVEAFGDIPWPHAQRLRRSIRDAIIDPTANREQFARDVMNLVSD
jgi:hypothetical protein